ncbi:hypothetical protein GRI75_08925 [Altererythrobacter soli]|uniref:Uncharacterized protein n=1 Tax=Croceibacterium soli TaxID=1739690 RepID=A0A6I4UW58_9SPHN|nr:hypothetical protein [Croceibacterium soli]MXP41763.1 hypothetical protein [Croceibacterium soli]
MAFRRFQRPKGQPLLVFSTVIGGWLVLRVLLWEPPFGGAPPAHPADRGAAGLASAGRTARIHAGTVAPAPWQRSEAPPALGSVSSPLQVPPSAAVALPRERVAPILPSAADLFTQEGSPAGPNAPHLSQVAEREPATDSADTRWSGDAWLLLRDDSAARLVAGRPAYGRSQTGAVLRYRLAQANGHRPTAYVRATRALDGPREREVAAGLAVRPLPDLPLGVAAELRVYEHPGGRETRGAAFAVTELPPARLPFGFHGELYAQVGYVGGKFATAFADGQLRVDRRVIGRGEGRALRIGAAVSGGAQERAARLDLGPSATVSFPLGEAHSRLALDYRFRIAGDAEPGDGPALTFSAGF